MAEYAHPEVLVDTSWVADHLNDPNVRIVESNEDILLYDQGHIPGAINRPYTLNLDQDGNFLPPDTLRTAFERQMGGVAARQVVHMCGSGVTACHNLIAMEHAGFTGSRLYGGSWSEWIRDPQRPVVKIS